MYVCEEGLCLKAISSKEVCGYVTKGSSPTYSSPNPNEAFVWCKEGDEVRLGTHYGREFRPMIRTVERLRGRGRKLSRPLVITVSNEYKDKGAALKRCLRRMFSYGLFEVSSFFLHVRRHAPRHLGRAKKGISCRQFRRAMLEPVFRGRAIFCRPFDYQG